MRAYIANGSRAAWSGEEWRIDAYRLLMDTCKSGAAWTDDQERLQGSLLGYEDWQNDWWIEYLARLREDPGT